MGRRVIFIACCLLLFSFNPVARAEDPWIGYSASGPTGKLQIFTVPSLKLLKEIQAGQDLQGLAASKDGKTVYLVDKADNRLIAVDTTKSKVVNTIPLPDHFGPAALAITPDGKSVCVSGELGGQVAKVDLAQGKVHSLSTEPKPSAPYGLAVTGDGKYCLVTDYINAQLLVFTLQPFKLEKKIGVGPEPHGVHVTPDNQYALVSDTLSAALTFVELPSLKVVKVLKTGAAPVFAVTDSKGKYAYQSQFVGNVITKIDLAKKTAVEVYPVKFRPTHLAITPDDQYLLVINKYSTGLFAGSRKMVSDAGGEHTPNNFQLIELSSGKSVQHAPVSGEPSDVVIYSAKGISDADRKQDGKSFFNPKAPPDLPPLKGAKVSYQPIKPHKPGVFDAPGGGYEIYLNAYSYQFAPNIIRVYQGDKVRFIITNHDQEADMIHHPDTMHGFTINGYADQAHVLLPQGVATVLEFTADKIGEFDFYCSYVCGVPHPRMRGKFIVE